LTGDILNQGDALANCLKRFLMDKYDLVLMLPLEWQGKAQKKSCLFN